MRKKKVLGMMLSFTLAFGLALPVSMAMPIDSSIVATGSNTIEKNDVATNSNTSEDKKVITESDNRKEKEEEVLATDSNAIETENESLATDSNAAKTENVILATDSNATMVESEHIETCVEGCTGEGCECLCHVPSLFERLMDCESLSEIWEIMDNASEKEMMELTEEEWNEIDALVGMLINASESSIVDVKFETDPIVESEIIFPIVTFTDVAPFGNPVVGKAE